MRKFRKGWFAGLFLATILLLPSSAVAQEIVIDSDTISGLGARNIGSAASTDPFL